MRCRPATAFSGRTWSTRFGRESLFASREGEPHYFPCKPCDLWPNSATGMSILSRLPFAFGADRSIRWLIFAGVFAVALAFAACTHHAWEDYYITYRVSKNLAAGHGLVYTVGERVHAFTSPINVLLPAVLRIITGNTSDELVLWLFRIVSCALLATAAVLLFEVARKNSLGLIAVAVLVGLFGLDAKIVDFSINGQESAFMMFFLALTLNALMVRSQRTVLKLGLAWAGLMWTRPDGFVYFGAIALGFLLFDAGRSIGESRLGLLRIFLRAGAVTTILYLPWFAWAWHYYGSPIPHTITAKACVSRYLMAAPGESPLEPDFLLINLLALPFRVLLGETFAGHTFLPTYWAFGGWPYAAILWSKCLSYPCALYWCLPFGQRQGRAASFAFMMSLFYLTDVAAYPAPWYFPNAAILGILVFAHIVQQGVDFARGLQDQRAALSRALTNLVRAVAALVLSITLVTTAASAYQLRIQQREIEDGVRTQIGLWLQKNAASTTDSVFLEPLGYIGFFSQLKMLDYPGLCAPEVVAVEKRLRSASKADIIAALRPDWLVLRSVEIPDIEHTISLAQLYSPVKTFDASQRLKAYRWLPGRPYLEFDQTFVVFRRNKDSAAAQSRN
jgi:hypothetical protein